MRIFAMCILAALAGCHTRPIRLSSAPPPGRGRRVPKDRQFVKYSDESFGRRHWIVKPRNGAANYCASGVLAADVLPDSASTMPLSAFGERLASR